MSKEARNAWCDHIRPWLEEYYGEELFIEPRDDEESWKVHTGESVNGDTYRGMFYGTTCTAYVMHRNRQSTARISVSPAGIGGVIVTSISS